MDSRKNSCPLDTVDTISKYFIENRSRLIDLAAYLDRIDRSVQLTDLNDSSEDFRIVAFRKALKELLTQDPGRVERIQLILSDLSLEPTLSAPHQKSASGAAQRECC